MPMSRSFLDADVEDLEADERVAAGAGKGHVHARRGPASVEDEDELVYDSEREEVLEKRAPAPDPADDSDEVLGVHSWHEELFQDAGGHFRPMHVRPSPDIRLSRPSR